MLQALRCRTRLEDGAEDLGASVVLWLYSSVFFVGMLEKTVEEVDNEQELELIMMKF